MALADIDGTQVWGGGAVPAPVIVHCPSAPDYPSCEGVENKLLLETTASGATTYPALMWKVPAQTPGVYRVSGDWRVPPGAPKGTPMTLLLVRNSRFDSVREERFSTTALPAAFDFEIEVLPDDILRLIAISQDATPAPLAVSFYISGTDNPGRCQRATTFQDDANGEVTFPDSCGTSIFADNATTDTQGPTGIPGRARVFTTGSYVEYQGSPNSYAEDWTVQFWAYLAPGGSGIETLLDDGDCDPGTGIDIYRVHLSGMESSQMLVDVYYEESGDCFVGPATITTSVTEDEWHFFRLTRTTGANNFSLCIDGQYAGEALAPGDADMSSIYPMQLGSDVFELPVFRGRLADLRVLDRSLPCAVP
jgi:hypothetical protein